MPYTSRFRISSLGRACPPLQFSSCVTSDGASSSSLTARGRSTQGRVEHVIHGLQHAEFQSHVGLGPFRRRRAWFLSISCGNDWRHCGAGACTDRLRGPTAASVLYCGPRRLLLLYRHRCRRRCNSLWLCIVFRLHTALPQQDTSNRRRHSALCVPRPPARATYRWSVFSHQGLGHVPALLGRSDLCLFLRCSLGVDDLVDGGLRVPPGGSRVVLHRTLL